MMFFSCNHFFQVFLYKCFYLQKYSNLLKYSHIIGTDEVKTFYNFQININHFWTKRRNLQFSTCWVCWLTEVAHNSYIYVKIVLKNLIFKIKIKLSIPLIHPKLWISPPVRSLFIFVIIVARKKENERESGL